MSNPSNPSRQINSPNVPGGYVTLPVTQADFSDFIKSLLGSPQAITKIYSGSFVCEPQTMRDVFHLFDQRISRQQHGSYLAKFTAVLNFEDFTSIELNSLDQLSTYNHLSDELCTDLSIEMQYIILDSAGKPEKQTILVIFHGSRPKSLNKKRLKNNDFVGVDLRVEFTDRTWGYDIVNLFDNFASSRFNDISLIAKFSNNILPGIIRNLPLALSVYPMYYLFKPLTEALAQTNTAAQVILKMGRSNNIGSLSDKIDQIALANAGAGKLIFPGSEATIVFILCFFAATILVFFRDKLISYITYKNSGYILLSDASRKYMNIEESNRIRGKYWIVVGSISSLLLSLVASFLYDLIKILLQ